MEDAAVTAVFSLVEMVVGILEKQANCMQKQNVKDVANRLKTINAYFEDANNAAAEAVQISRSSRAQSDHAALHRDRANQLRDIAHDIEDVLDEFLLAQVPHHYHRHAISKQAHSFAHLYAHRLALRELSSQFDNIRRKIDKVLAFDPRLPSLQSRRAVVGATPSFASSQRVEDHANHDEIVGFEKPKRQLIRILELPVPPGEGEGEGEAKRTTISVVGAAGSGKSLLVNTVYQDQIRVEGRYDCHAWIRVSPNSFKLNTQAFFRRMLTQFSEIIKRRPDLLHEEILDVRGKLKRLLEGRRYLLVLDDVWSKEDCEAILRELPSGSHGSTVIITTRNSNVVVINSATHHHHVHYLQGLSPQHSWELFCNKAFPHAQGYCPKELVEISKSIVTKCEGSPYAIVAVGSLLSNREQTPVAFRDLLASLGSEIEPGSNLSNIGKIHQLSYNHLSCNLKSCLLYFSMLPEDHTIRCQRLIRLWVAEGFIKERRHKTVEKVAEEYLDELIARNLVQATSWDIAGRVTTCRVLNLVREFLIHKSQEENFATILSIANANIANEWWNKINAPVLRRLSIHHGWSQQYKEISDLGRVRTLSMFGVRYGIPSSLNSECSGELVQQCGLFNVMFPNMYDGPSLSSEIGKFLDQFRLLKVLDLEGAPLDTFPEEIAKLTLLTYLSLKDTRIKTIPESIKKLAYLQTLNLKQTDVTELPPVLFALKSLRHLLVCRYINVENYETFDSVQGAKFPRGIKELVELQKLSLVRLINSNEGMMIEELGALTQLRKLRVGDLKREDGGKLGAAISKMPDLLCLEVSSTSQKEYMFLDDEELTCPPFLQRLCLKGRLVNLPWWVSSPYLDSLVRIQLKWSKLRAEANPLGALGALPNILELEMVDAYMGTRLEFKSHWFKKLKVLYLEQLVGIKTLVIEKEAMPTLEKLTICKCPMLETLPSGIRYLAHLQELFLHDMNQSFLNMLEKGSDRYLVDHINTIKSFKLDGSSQFWTSRSKLNF